MKAYENPDRIWTIQWRIHPIINGKTNWHHSHLLKKLTFPVEILQRRYWYVRLVNAILQTRFPKYSISQYTDMHTGNGETPLKLRISAAKAQITKVKNGIERYKKEKSTELFPLSESDPIYQKLLLKLEEKEFKFNQLIGG